MKLSNSKYIFLGKIGNSINSLHLTQLDLIKQKKEYLRALKKFSNYQDQLEGLNAFIEQNLSSDAEIQKDIVNLYIELIIDSKSYNSIVDVIDQKISELQEAIEKYVLFDNDGIGAKIRYYTTEINKIINKIQSRCDADGIDFVWAPISHTSNRVHTLYSILSKTVTDALENLSENDLKNITDEIDGNDTTNDIRAYLTSYLLPEGVFSDALYNLGDGATIDYTINGKPLDLTGDNNINKYDQKEFDALKAEYVTLMNKSDKTAADNKRITEIKGKIDFNNDDNIDDIDSAYISTFDPYAYLISEDKLGKAAYIAVSSTSTIDQARGAILEKEA